MHTTNISIVLAHGAWADGSSWAKVIILLKKQGFEVLAAPLPLTTLADDVSAVERTIARAKNPVVLVGHAYAGAVIAEVRSEKIKALVYVAALAPDEGEKIADVFYRNEPHPTAPKLAPDANGLIWLPQNAFADAFAPNANSEDLLLLAAIQRPISIACITVPVKRPLWKDLPTWYLLAEDDHMIVKENQRFMSERMKANVKSVAVDHTPSVTAPSIVVDIILKAVKVI